MNEIAIEGFAGECEARRRITFADVKRLRRDVAPDGLTARAEVERLMTLDRAVKRADASWTDWLVSAVVDFAVWGERPTGTVEGEAADWLAGLIGGAPSTRAARLIAREVAREAERVDTAIVTLAGAAEASLAAPQAEVRLAA